MQLVDPDRLQHAQNPASRPVEDHCSVQNGTCFHPHKFRNRINLFRCEKETDSTEEAAGTGTDLTTR